MLVRVPVFRTLDAAVRAVCVREPDIARVNAGSGAQVDEDVEGFDRRGDVTRSATGPAGDLASGAASLVVGIGASAGGLEAFKAFFTAMPSDSGMAFVLVQHLDPDHASVLAEIVSGCTAMSVTVAEDGMAIAPNRVFVTPPDAILTLESGVLRLTRPATTISRRRAIDTFLTSLAEDQGDDAVGIILSGYGSDGSLGVEVIKEHGGLTLSQAEFDHAPKIGMPQNATATGWVDHVLAVEAMPAALLEHVRFRARLDDAKGPDGLKQEVADHLGAISAVLHSRLGRDVSQYKTKTIMRRVQRRMQVLKIDTVTGYIAALREQPDEPDLLFREVLIRVTRFFRDPAAFEALAENCIEGLLAKGRAEDVIRVWVPGCATGEEAYSLAILFKEAMALADRPRRIQIFATDVDDQAIGLARAGLYPETIAADLSPQRLERYFQRDGDQYRVSKDLREMCLFSVHDLVKDPPFSRLDLISCRNLLIYFAAPLQKRVVQMFHYGLKPDGTVLLGASEALTAHARLFATVDKKHRLFRRLNGSAQPLILPSPPTMEAIATGLPEPDGPEVGASIARALLQFTPAYVIIDQHYEVQQFFGPIAKYLEPASGPASFNLSKLVHSSLRAPLRAALKKARSTQGRVVESDLDITIGDQAQAVNLIVEPLRGADDQAGLVLVAFQDLPSRQRALAVDAPATDYAVSQEQLQTITEELETANEELQSSNEEYQSINEELQSANEELETAKEELQSINEELQAVNAELATRNEKLTDLNSDLSNLIDSTSIATLFLDRDLRIKRFTPAILELFNVRDGDQGRPITDIVSHLGRDGLEQDVKEVMRTLIPVQREVALVAGNRAYQMHVRPYRDLNHVINGVVVTFVDISERKRAEANRGALAAIIDSSSDAIISTDLDDVIISWNRGAERFFGFNADEAVDQALAILMPHDRADEDSELLRRVKLGERIDSFETVLHGKNGGIHEVSLTVSPVRDSEGAIVGVSKIVRDIAERKQAERRSDLLLGELDHRVKNILAIVSSVVSQTRKTAATPEAFAAAIEGRIQAIAKAHSLLTRGGRLGATLAAIVETELAPYRGVGQRVTVSGDEVILTPKAGMALSMTIHELTTNAVKHGALSVPEGRLEIRWTASGDGMAPLLRIDWTESEGPPVTPPTRRGFGATLIERALAYEFDAQVKREFHPSGLTCMIKMPLSDEVGCLGPRDSGGSHR